MTYWISLDWDFITGDCRVPKQANRCTSNCCDCSDTGVIGRGDNQVGFATWQERLDITSAVIKDLHISNCVVRDNHGEIMQFIKRGDIVYNYDYHTDDYDSDLQSPVSCWNWVNYCEKQDIKVYNCYTLEELKLLSKSRKYRMFVAWSVPYTRSDLDGHLFRFLMNMKCEVKLNAKVL